MNTNPPTAPTPHVLQVACDQRLIFIVRRACAVWSDVLSGHVTLVPWQTGSVINVTVGFGVIVSDSHSTLAQCSRISPDRWVITLDRSRRWSTATSWFGRLFGKGENAFATVIHEMGHIFRLPHAADPSWVMYHRYAGSGSMSLREKEHYRNFFLTEVDV